MAGAVAAGSRRGFQRLADLLVACRRRQRFSGVVDRAARRRRAPGIGARSPTTRFCLENSLQILFSFLKQYRIRGVALLLGHPLILLWRMPARLAVTLWRSRVLLKGHWRKYMGFHPLTSVNYLFYRVQAINLARYGRSGRSPIVGLGEFPLSQWFHVGLPGLNAYAKAGAVATLGGMAVWWLSHLLWLQTADARWVAIVLALTLFSTGFFAMAFVLQNYNVLGWMFLPAGLFAISQGHYELAALAWFAASLAGLTPLVFAGAFVTVLAIEQMSLAPVLSIIPAIGLYSLNLWPAYRNIGMRSAIAFTAKAIGATDRHVRYRYTSKRFSARTAYFVVTGTLFIVTCSWVASPPWLFVVPLALFVVNRTLARFVDEQSAILAMMTGATTIVMTAAPDPWLAATLWLVISPTPVLMVPTNRSALSALADLDPREPVDITLLEDRMRAFLHPVAPGQRVLMAFSDPEGIYERLFDGYSTLLQLPLYVSATRGIHFMPDWWAVFETNYENAPSFWGRSVAAVKKNAEYWHAEFVVVYQNTGSSLDDEWSKAGFISCGEFDWAECTPVPLEHGRWFGDQIQKWWLLRRPLALEKTRLPL